AWVHFRAGRSDDAESCYRRAAEMADDAGSEYERARALTGLGNTAAGRGDRQAAARWWAEAAAYRVTLNPAVLGEARDRDRLTGAQRSEEHEEDEPACVPGPDPRRGPDGHR